MQHISSEGAAGMLFAHGGPRRPGRAYHATGQIRHARAQWEYALARYRYSQSLRTNNTSREVEVDDAYDANLTLMPWT